MRSSVRQSFPIIFTLLKQLSLHWYVWLYFGFWISYFAFFWARAIYFSDDGGLHAGHVNMWGDWAVHFTMGSSMAYKSLIPVTSPLLLGEQFTYPFGSNLISAVLIRVGVPFFSAFIVPSFLGSIAIVATLYALYKQIFTSRTIAVLAALIFLLNGGLGFTNYISDIQNAPDPLQTAVHPTKTYSGDAERNIRWVSVIETMIIPQRAFTLGFPLAIGIINLFLISYASFDSKSSKQILSKKNKVILTGMVLCLGVLPIFHAHSFLAVAVILAFWGVAALVLAKQRVAVFALLLSTAVLSLVIAIPLLKTYVLGNTTMSFQEWYPGWYAKETGENWLGFWLKNWSITPILAIGGLLHLIKSRKGLESISTAIFFAPFFLLFILANLIKFQPFLWDNTKLIVWASVGISGLAAYAIVMLYRVISNKIHRIFAGILCTILVLAMTITASIDTYRIQRISDHSYQMYSAEEVLAAYWVRDNTPANSVWLTADNHNNWLYNLTGRQPVMAYRGWLWTHGYSYQNHEQLVQKLYQNPMNIHLFQEATVEYVIVSPAEINDWQADPSLFAQTFEQIYNSENISIFKTP